MRQKIVILISFLLVFPVFFLGADEAAEPEKGNRREELTASENESMPFSVVQDGENVPYERITSDKGRLQETSSDAFSREDEEKAEKSPAFRFSASPYTLCFFLFPNGYGTSSSRVVTRSVYGCSATLTFGFPFMRWFFLSPEFGYAFVLRKENVIPEAGRVHFFRGGAAVGIELGTPDSFAFHAGLMGGAMIHVSNMKASLSPYAGIEAGCDFPLSGNLSLGVAASGVCAFFLNRKNRLADSMTLLINPVSVTASYSF